MKLSRRQLLQGIAGATIALPFLESVARAAPSPKRFIYVYTPNGLPKEAWTPSGSGSSFTMSPILQPLDAHRDYINVIDGLDNVAAQCGGHGTATVTLLTGRVVKAGAPAGLDNGGISIDQKIAQAIGLSTHVQSIQLSALPIQDRWISSTEDAILQSDADPLSVYAKLFGGSSMNGGDAAAALKLLRQRRGSVLDAAVGDIHSLRGRASSGDKQRLDAHFTAIRAVETALDAEIKNPILCAAPPAPTALDLRAIENYPKIVDLQTQLLVLALRCDVTRVASIQWGVASGGIPFTWLGINTESHELSHHCGIDPDYVKVCTWYTEKFADLVAQLRDPLFADANGMNVLDSSVVVWANELSACTHDTVGIPVVLAGKAGGALQTNRFLQFGHSDGCVGYPSRALNQLYVSLLNMFGIPDNQFGDPQFGSGPLPGL